MNNNKEDWIYSLCLDCNFVGGTLLKEFDNEENYSWYELSEMTEVCASCGSENIKTESEE